MTLFLSCRRCHATIKADDAKACAIRGCPLCADCWDEFGCCPNHTDEELARVLDARDRQKGDLNK
jgi:hypothetical protein